MKRPDCGGTECYAHKDGTITHPRATCPKYGSASYDPPPGSWAETARVMADAFPDFDWDAWKDEMKEGDL